MTSFIFYYFIVSGVSSRRYFLTLTLYLHQSKQGETIWKEMKQHGQEILV